MTLIKKFAWSGTAVALAMIMAMTMLVQTAYAVAPTLSGDGTTIKVGEEVNLAVTTDVGTVTLTSSSTAIAFVIGTTTAPNATIAANGNVRIRGISTNTGVTITASNEDGSVTSIIAVVAAPAPVVATLTLPAITTPFGTGNATADILDINGDPSLGQTVTFTVTGSALLRVSASGGSTCSTSATFTATTCNATTGRGVSGVAGQASAGIQGTGSGGYTLTATAGSATDTKSATIASQIGSVVITEVTRLTTQAGTNLIVRAQARDAAGNVIPNQNITFSGTGAGFDDFTTVADTTCAAPVGTPETLNSGNSGTASIRVCIAAGATSGQLAIVTVSSTGSDNVTRTISTTITVAGEVETVEVAAPATSAVGGTASVTATVKDADNRAIAGISVTFSVTGGLQGNAVTPTTVTTNAQGVATVTFVSGGNAGNAIVTAVVGDKSGSATINVGGTVTPPPASGPGTFASPPTFGTGTVGSAVFNGGTLAQLAAAVTAAGGSSVWTQDANGIWRVHVVGAAAFVNAGFNTAFASGFAGPTAVFVVK